MVGRRFERASSARLRDRERPAPHRRYQFWRLHVRSLADQAGVSNPDALAGILLAPLAPDIYRIQRDERGLAKRDVIGALTMLAERVLGD